VRPGGAGEPHGAKELEREAVGEIFVGQIEELAALGGAGVVDQDVDLSESLDSEVGDPPAGVGQAQIQCNGVRGSPGATNLGCGGIEQRLVTGAQNHARPCGCQAHRDAASDAPAGAGHDRNLTL
jgi:hypothetical protein